MEDDTFVEGYYSALRDISACVSKSRGDGLETSEVYLKLLEFIALKVEATINH